MFIYWPELQRGHTRWFGFFDSEEPRRGYTRWFGAKVAFCIRAGSTVDELSGVLDDMCECEPEGIA